MRVNRMGFAWATFAVHGMIALANCGYHPTGSAGTGRAVFLTRLQTEPIQRDLNYHRVNDERRVTENNQKAA